MTANLSSTDGGNFASRFVPFATQKIKNFIPTVVAIAIILVVWQVLCSLPGAALPSPSKVVADTWDPFIIDPFSREKAPIRGLFWQLIASLKRVGLGYLLAATVGISLGILVGVSVIMFQALDPVFQVLRTIPPLAWLPISLAALKEANPAAIFVIFITAIWPIIINTGVGVQNIPQDYNNVAKVLQLSRSDYFFKVLLPASVPYIFTGLKIAVGLSWLAIVAAEMLTGGVGIGFFIWDAYNSGNLSEVILAVLYVGLVGLVLDKMITFLGHLVVPEEQK